MAVLTCKICGGDLTVLDGKSYAICGSCGIKQTMPRFDDDKRTNLYNRANHYRRNQDFDKAIAIYETILNEDGQDAEAYWSLVLCKYGVEFVQDPETSQWMITCNRTQFTSIFGDEDYKAAIQYASSAFAKRDYEKLASWIEEIQKEILEISKNEKPYDIFICYKESDQNKKRTLDSALAQDIYQELINEGYRIFFSRITLTEVALGKDYEPQIFAALNSAKIMILVGTSPMNINSPWVKNEWTRFLALIKQGAKKTLIVAYRDMNPCDLPDELSRVQALDMARIGFLQDLSHGIKKLLNAGEKTKADSAGTTSVATKNNDALLDRAYMCLEDRDYAKATLLLEQVLNTDPRNGRAYLGQLLAKHGACRIEQLSSLRELLGDDPLYRRAIQFSNQETKSKLEDVVQNIKVQLEKELDQAYTYLENNDYSKASRLFGDAVRCNPKSGRAYLGQLLIKHKVSKIEQIPNDIESLYEEPLYQNAIQYSDHEVKRKLETIALIIDHRIKKEIKEREDRRNAEERAQAIKKAKEDEQRAAAERAQAIEQKRKEDELFVQAELAKRKDKRQAFWRKIGFLVWKVFSIGTIGAIIGLLVGVVGFVFAGLTGHGDSPDAFWKPIIVCGGIGIFIGFFVGVFDN